MKKKRVDLQIRGNSEVYKEGILVISKEENEYFFEIGNDITSDIAEAVSIMMRKIDWKSGVWNLELDVIDIVPEKTLFWLSGGYSEWRTLENYNRPWSDCYLDFQEEFGSLVFNITKRSKTLGEIRDNFIIHLGLPKLYEFALSKGLIRINI